MKKFRIGDRIEFRGCAFVVPHWEFDMPCILYQGTKEMSVGGNYGRLIDMVEDAMIDVCLGYGGLKRSFSRFEKTEAKSHGWDIHGFSRRKNATHVRVIVEITEPDNSDDEFSFEFVSEEKRRGPFQD